MEIVINNIEQFRVFFDVIYDIASDMLELQFFADRLSCSVLDGSHSCFFHAEFKSIFFSRYDVDEIGSVTVFVDDLYKLLKLTNKTDELILKFDEYHMTAEVVSKKGNTRLFEFVLPSDFIESPKYPPLQTACVVEVDSSEIKQSVKDIALVGTHVFQIVVNADSVVYMCDTSAVSDEYSSTKYAQTVEMETGADETLISRFTLKNIKKIMDFDKISKTVKLGVGMNYPLLFKFEDNIMGVSVNGMIAPRLEIGED